MNLSQIAFKYRPVVLLITVAMMIFGAKSYFTLTAQEDPVITIREAITITRFPGLPAERMELLVTKPLEEALKTVHGVEEIRSTSTDGVSIIYTKAYDNVQAEDLAQIWNEVEETAHNTHSRLPEGTQRSIVNDNFGDVAVITLALTGKDFEMSELYDYAQYVRDRLNSVDGTRNVKIVGAKEERIYIEVQNAVLAKAGLSPDVIFNTLNKKNILKPGGVIDTGGKAFSIRVSGEFHKLDEVKQLLIRVPKDGSYLRLSDLASISKGYADPSPRSAFFNGEPALVLSVVMQPGQSVLNYSKVAERAINSIRNELPVGLSLSTITWQADQVEGAVYGVTSSVLQTLAIVMGVVILFLGVRTGVIVGSIVPAVVLATLAIMSIFDMALERMSLATIVIALGLLVDNGVVIAEDFKRRLADHSDRGKALKDTGKELAIPLLSSSLTTILVFTPLMLAQHPSGEYTRNISLVILITLSISWLLAMTVTPTLCYLLMKTPGESQAPSEAAGMAQNASNVIGEENDSRYSEGIFGRIERDYEKLLRWVLHYRKLFIVFMFLLLPVGGFLAKSAPQKFFPDSDRAQVLIYVNLPAGVTTRATEDRIKTMMDLMLDKEKYPDLDNLAAYVGFGGPRFVLSLAPLDQAPNVGFIVANVKDKKTLNQIVPLLREEFRAKVPDVNARVSGMFLGPSDPNVIQVQVKGPDLVYIQEQAKLLEAAFAEVPGSIDIWSNWFNPVTRLEVRVDQNRALNAGVTSEDVARTLSAYVSGSPVSQFRDFDESFPIVSRAIGQERVDLNRIKAAAIFPQGSSQSIPLEQVAEIIPTTGFSHIQREDLSRTVTVEARNLLITPEDMAPIIQEKIDEMNARIRPGHVVEFDGIVSDAAVGKQALFAGFPVCLGLALILLVAQFNGYLRPLIVISTIPLTLIGVGLGLVVMGAEFGFLVILGFFALAGIIVNNGIVLIDRIDIERSLQERTEMDAVIVASVRRLRPILITTLTTIVGLLPLMVGRDVLFYGMASIMAFGLAIGTALTLCFVPALYCVLFKIPVEK